ncbi:hypothetical protein CK203_025418 [Vitis vinifera]|uniref:Uncharacterized protein n=1 Tax=Vitis vinifera TaxID=29760 RepID=A0A438IZT6_VITVI|nr:hypothetical protein CK203_025418 [Vitis vinifera]
MRVHSMCGGDDHLAWKRLISSEACRRLCTSRRKIAEIIDRPLKRDQIQMVLRSLQPRIARHVVGVPFTDFGSLVLALYDVEDGISKGLWTDSSPSDVKGKKPFG